MPRDPQLGQGILNKKLDGTVKSSVPSLRHPPLLKSHLHWLRAQPPGIPPGSPIQWAHQQAEGPTQQRRKPFRATYIFPRDAYLSARRLKSFRRTKGQLSTMTTVVTASHQALIQN